MSVQSAHRYGLGDTLTVFTLSDITADLGANVENTVTIAGALTLGMTVALSLASTIVC